MNVCVCVCVKGGGKRFPIESLWFPMDFSHNAAGVSVFVGHTAWGEETEFMRVYD